MKTFKNYIIFCLLTSKFMLMNCAYVQAQTQSAISGDGNTFATTLNNPDLIENGQISAQLVPSGDRLTIQRGLSTLYVSLEKRGTGGQYASMIANPVSLNVSCGDDDNVRIPDPAFRRFLEEDNNDISFQGEYLPAEYARSVEELYIPWASPSGGDPASPKIRDLTGIEAFTALTTLDVSNHDLTSIDVSNLTNLVFLDITGNQGISEVDLSSNSLIYFYAGGTSLARLDLSGNTRLKQFDASGTSLARLDLSGNSQLTHLFMWDNRLTQLDISHLESLTDLEVGNLYGLLSCIQASESQIAAWRSEVDQDIPFTGRQWKVDLGLGQGLARRCGSLVPFSAPTGVQEGDIAITLDDDIEIIDNGSSNYTVTLAATGGTITLGTQGITFSDAAPNNSSSVTATGSLEDMNNALDAAVFIPTPDFHGAASITMSSGDEEETVSFTIAAVNDPPRVILNSQLTIERGSSTNAIINQTQLNATDVDNEDQDLVYTVRSVPTQGRLLLLK